VSGLRRRFARRGVSLSDPKPTRNRLTLHSRLVLIATANLIIVPALLFPLFEHDPGMASRADQAAVMSGRPLPHRLLDGLFLSVTCRTAGFQTVATDVEALTPASRFLSIVLMFIGGSPASTAGGVKTLAVTVLVLTVLSQLGGRGQPEIFHRRISQLVVQRAGVLVLIMFTVVTAVALMLCLTEGAGLAEVLFESVSACATVGLSNGLTTSLTLPGRFVIMLGMFAGRLGPLTVLVALAGRVSTGRYEYPAEHVGIG